MMIMVILSHGRESAIITADGTVIATEFWQLLTRQCLCVSEVPKELFEVGLTALSRHCVSSKSTLRAKTRELLGLMKENNILSDNTVTSKCNAWHGETMLQLLKIQ